VTGPEGFDRLRRRSPGAAADPTIDDTPQDPQGRRSLFSVAQQPPSVGAVTVSCSSCGLTSVATPRQVVGLAVPSLHLPLVKRGHPSWMRCPACGTRTWVRLGLRL
jgi:hypothetical protein